MAIYCDKCGARHDCSVCPVCHGFGTPATTMTDELWAKFEEYIEQLRERAANLLGSPTSHRHMGKSEGYTDCADELQALLDAHFASRDAEVEALKRDAKRYRKLLALLDAAEQVSNEASTIRNIIEDSIGLGSEYLNLHLDAMAKESQK